MRAFILVCLLAAAPIVAQDPETITPEQADKYNDEIITLAKSMQSDLDTEKAGHAGVSANLVAATQKLGTLQNHIDQLTTQTYEQAVTIQKEKNRILRDDIIFGILTVAAIALAAWKFGLFTAI